MSDVNKLLKQIKYGEKSLYDQIDKWIEDENSQEMSQLVQALIQLWDEKPSKYSRYAGRIYRILDIVALKPGRFNAEILLSVFKNRPKDDKLVRRVAAQLATLPSEVLDQSIISSTPNNLVAYLIHELVIEGIDLSMYPSLSAMSQSIQDINHELDVLPHELVSAESELQYYRWHFEVGGGSVHLPFGPMGEQEDGFVLSDEPSEIKLDEITTPSLQTRLRSAFENWDQESNGKIEARQFLAAFPLSSDLLTHSRLLLDLGLDCLEGATTHQVRLWDVPATQIITTLFSAAANGGAYNDGVGNVYGRLYAWNSAAALMNESEQTPIRTLNEEMDDCLWFVIDAHSAWFYRVAWDAAIVCVARDRRVLTMLAATDTD